MAEFKKRVYGCAIVKAINSNYNADFSGQPRTLSDGIVYATDKAFKYSIKKYLKDAYENVDVFYMKTLNDNLNPRSLDERYENLFGPISKEEAKKKKLPRTSYHVLMSSCLVQHLQVVPTFLFMDRYK